MLHEVKSKLLTKAIDRYNLLNGHMRSDSDGAADGPVAAPAASDMEQPAVMIPNQRYIKEYPECPMAFDQMLISLTQYFELVNMNSYKLEDLWLNLLDVMCLERPNRYTVFKAVHHQGFRNIILKDPLIQQIVREAESYKDSGLVHMNPKLYLEQIYNIRRNCATAEESYSYFAESGLQSESLR